METSIFLHFSVKRSETCKIIAYLNEKEVAHLSGPAFNDQLEHITLFICILSFPVLAVEIHRSSKATESVPIVSNTIVSSASSGCIIQSVSSIASGDSSTAVQATYTFDFKNNYWSPSVFPATLRFTFANATVVVNRTGFYGVNRGTLAFPPKSWATWDSIIPRESMKCVGYNHFEVQDYGELLEPFQRQPP